MSKKNFLGKVLGLIVIIVMMFFFIRVDVKAVYVNPDKEFRAVWVTPWGGDSDLVTYTSEESFKSNMNYILDVMEEYNMNALIYHIRTHNNALYQSDINPIASYWSNVNFQDFDPLTWLIEECHKRGIEFHAWLNPYRVKTTYQGTLEEFSTSVQHNNIASDVNNLLETAAGGIILNPAKFEVRQFIIQTIEEIMNRYNVDAIHFDDYFYANMGANGALSGTTTILNEADQIDYEAYIDDDIECDYSKTSAPDKADWRREQVNLLIEGISTFMNTYNENNTRYVQFGIAPTGIYKNGDGIVTYNEDGTAITTGSNTGGQTHYSSYLFCDTLKWCNEGWIDYIIPQSYWGITHPIAGYQEVMNWWNQVIKNLDVNLYSGIGLYMADEVANTYSWQTDDNELLNQLTFLTNLNYTQGASIYNFNNLRKLYDGGTSQVATQLADLGTNCWNKMVTLPEISSMESMYLSKVANFVVNDNTLTWDKTTGSKFYAIYRSSNNLTFNSTEIVDIVGGSFSEFTWTDSETGVYNYGIAAISYTNTIGEPTEYISNELEEIQVYNSRSEVISDLIADYNTIKGTSYTLQYFNDYTSTGYNYFAGLDGATTFFSDDDMRIKWSWLLEYFKNIRINTGLNINQYDSLINNGYIIADAATINVEMIAFIASKQYTASGYSSSDYSLAINNDGFWEYSPCENVVYTVSFVDYDGTILKIENVINGDSATAPVSPTRQRFIFSNWDVDFSNITNHTTVTAIYVASNYAVNIQTNNSCGSASVTIGENSGLYIDTIYGSRARITANNGIGNFMFWVYNDKIVSFNSTYEFNVTGINNITAYFSEGGKFAVAFVDTNMKLIDFVLVESGDIASTTMVPDDKPGYTFVGFDESDNIVENTICYANYIRQDIYYTINVSGGVIITNNETSKTVIGGTVLTITTDMENFVSWTRNGKVISYERTYLFSVYENMEIIASNTGIVSSDLFINLSTPIIDGSDSIGFTAQIENIGFKSIVEYGFIYIYGESKSPFEDVGAIKKQSIMKSTTNEYALILEVLPLQSINVVGYVVIDNSGVYYTIYSDLKSYTNNQENTINYNVNYGILPIYLYDSREEVVNEFIVDFNLTTGANITSTTMHSSSNDMQHNTFWQDDTMYSKWKWLAQYIYDIGTHSIAISIWNNIINGIDLGIEVYSYWPSKRDISGFLSGTNCTWYISTNPIDFTNEVYSNGFWNYAKTGLVPETYLSNENTTLPIPTREGYTFDGWYTNPAFLGNQVIVIPIGSSGEKNFYAKWIE